MASNCAIAYDMIKQVLKRKMLPEEHDEIPAKALKTFFQKSVTPGFCYTAGAEHALAKVTCMFSLFVASSAKGIAKKKNRKRIFGNDILTAVNTAKMERLVAKINENLSEYMQSVPNEQKEMPPQTEIPSASHVLDDVITIESDSEEEIVPENSDGEEADSECSDSMDFDVSGSDAEKHGDSEGSDSSVEICGSSVKNNENETMATGDNEDKNISTSSIGINKDTDTTTNDLESKETSDDILNDQNINPDQLEDKNAETNEAEAKHVENNLNNPVEESIDCKNITSTDTMNLANNANSIAESGDVNDPNCENKNDDENKCIDKREENSDIPNGSGFTIGEIKMKDNDGTNIVESTSENEQNCKNIEAGNNNAHLAAPIDQSGSEVATENVNDGIEANNFENGIAS